MSGSSVVKNLLRRWQTHQTLPYLKQGSSISIRSTIHNTNLRIRSQWRDDGDLSFTQYSRPNEINAILSVARNEDKRTSLGRDEAHVSITLNEGLILSDRNLSNYSDDEIPLIGSDYSNDNNLDSLEFPSLTLDVPDKINLDCDLTKGGTITIESKIEGDVHLKIRHGTISVKKVRGHSIDFEITGESHADDDPPATTGVGPSYIFVSDVLESQDLRISLPCSVSSRIRAKRIHANKLDIQLGGDGNLLQDGENSEKLVRTNNGGGVHSKEPLDDKFRFLDDDDSGAACDISSLYMIGDAHVSVFGESLLAVNKDDTATRIQPQAVRIKSHHGHVYVETTTSKPDFANDMTGDVLPIVDLGGINGSCEVKVSLPPNDGSDDHRHSPSYDYGTGWTSCHAHFDNIARDSVSVLQTESGRVHVTIDRKVESDVRMLSLPIEVYSSTAFDMETLILEDNDDGTVADELSRMLNDLDVVAAERSTPILAVERSTSILAAERSTSILEDMGDRTRIQIQTKAFTSRERQKLELIHDIEFVDGWVENTTSEPDSRFDRKVRGVTEQQPHGGGGGKIRLDGAYDQALQGFQQRTGGGGGESLGQDHNALNSAASSSSSRPLLAVCSPDGIVLESLSWLGNIARRYGLDETREKDDLGRQATRRGRLAADE
jgi:hypothetical protein